MFKKRLNVDPTRAAITLQDGKVLIQGAGSAELVNVLGTLKCTVRFTPVTAQWVVQLVDVRASMGQPDVTLLEERFAELEMDKAKAYHATLTAAMGPGVTSRPQAPSALGGASQKSRLRRVAGKVFPWMGGAVIAFVVLQVMGLMMGYDEETMRLAQAQKLALEAAAEHAGSSAPAASQMPGAGEAASSRLTPEELLKVKGAASLQLGTGKGRALYVFSDPNCLSCQRIETALEALSGEFTVRIIPVAFRNGSESLTGSVMCARSSEIAAAWSAGIKSGQTRGAACAEGVKKVQANNELFASLGFTHTPTLVSESGALAVGDASADDLRRWINLN